MNPLLEKELSEEYREQLVDMAIGQKARAEERKKRVNRICIILRQEGYSEEDIKGFFIRTKEELYADPKRYEDLKHKASREPYGSNKWISRLNWLVFIGTPIFFLFYTPLDGGLIAKLLGIDHTHPNLSFLVPWAVRVALTYFLFIIFMKGIKKNKFKKYN